VYTCPVCTSALRVKSGDLSPVGHTPSILADEDLSLGQVYSEELRPSDSDRLVTC
jgi:hypothetical protein